MMMEQSGIDLENYKDPGRVWYGHIFADRWAAILARYYSRYHDPADRIVRVWGGWKITPKGGGSNDDGKYGINNAGQHGK